MTPPSTSHKHTVRQRDIDGQSALALAARSRYFTGLVIDDLPELLEESFRLRYQVYCLERAFLRPDDYPDRAERDRFDTQSVHLGAVNTEGTLVATARLVEAPDGHLPLFDHCTIAADDPPLPESSSRIVEISRLSVSRRYNRRAGDGFYSEQVGGSPHYPERRGDGAIVFAIYKAIYQVSKRRGFTHWVMAAERSLRRLVDRYGFPFRAIGPESDYYGMVQPYLMELEEFDQVIASGRIVALDEFLVGLEPEFWPAGLARPDGGDVIHELT